MRKWIHRKEKHLAKVSSQSSTKVWMQIHVCWCQWSDPLHYPTWLLLSRLKWLKELCLIVGASTPPAWYLLPKGPKLYGFHEDKQPDLCFITLRFQKGHRVGMNYKLGVNLYYLKTIVLKQGNTKSKDMKMLKGSWYIFTNFPLKRLYEFTCPWTWYTNNHLITSLPSLVQSLSHVWLIVTPWTAACQASLSFTSSWSLLKLMSIKLTALPGNCNYTILCQTNKRKQKETSEPIPQHDMIWTCPLNFSTIVMQRLDNQPNLVFFWKKGKWLWLNN